MGNDAAVRERGRNEVAVVEEDLGKKKNTKTASVTS